MAHLGVITPPVFGHLHPFGALGRELQARGHHVTVFHMPDLAPMVQSEGLDFYAIGHQDHPLGTLQKSLQNIGRRKGWDALRFSIGEISRTTDMLCRDAPAALKKAGIEFLLVDQTEPAGGILAKYLRLPFVTICNALAMNREIDVPPPSVDWSYRMDELGRLRNRVGYLGWDFVTKPIYDVVRRYQRHWGFKPFQDPDDTFSSLAQISQQPAAFDYPRKQLPAHFHYVGPLRRPHEKHTEFPWERLDGRPLIYASLGTLQGSKIELFRVIADVCKDLPVQLVMSHAKSLSDEEVQSLAGRPLVVPYAPQWELLEKVTLTLTHAGLNTTLDSLAHAVPLVAIPITFEQPGIAARIAYSGVGRFLKPSKVNAVRLRTTLEEVLGNPIYRAKAKLVAQSIADGGGVKRAADITEIALRTDQPVLRIKIEA